MVIYDTCLEGLRDVGAHERHRTALVENFDEDAVNLRDTPDPSRIPYRGDRLTRHVQIGSLFPRAPMMVSMPLRQNWSFREMGRPWRGPMILPCVLRWSSTSWARAKARSMKISVKQFVYGMKPL